MSNKGGISAIVSIVFILLVTILAVSTIWIYLVPLFSQEINFKEAQVSIVTVDGYTAWDESSKSLSVHIYRGSDESEIEGLQFVFFDEGSSVQKIIYDYPQPNQKKVYGFDASYLSSRPESVGVAPVYIDGTIGKLFILDFRIPDGIVNGELYSLDESNDVLLSNLNSLNDNVLIVYNKNTQDGKEIAEYYANAREINNDHICGISIQPGQYATADNVLVMRKDIIENCICNLLSSKPSPCDLSNIDEISRLSPITHLAIIKGIPPRMTGTGWPSDNEDPSLDYYLSFILYSPYLDFLEISSTGSHSPTIYQGSYSTDIDYQPQDSVEGYVRSIIPLLDKQVSYGRIEAMTKERTFDLIDRTIEAENRGFQGNFFIGSRMYTYLPKNFEFFKKLTSSEDCVSYMDSLSDWPFNCRFGVALSQMPGESSSKVPRPINAGIILSDDYSNQGHSAFDGFNNMLNWRKTSDECIPLCEDITNENEKENCILNSKDYFKEINTDCVGVDEGFFGWQLRSWPVQYYGFKPAGWSSLSGGNGAYDTTPSLILSGDSYKDTKFTDDKYLRYGSLYSVDNPTCINSYGSVVSCKEIIGVNLRQSITLTPKIYVDGNYSYLLKFRYKAPFNDNKRIYMYLYSYLDDGTSHSNKGQYYYFNSESPEWSLAEVELNISGGGEEVKSLLLDIYSSISTAPQGFLELDGFELIDKQTGLDVLNKEASSFSLPNHQTNPGDYAANVIDRLGGIAWFGSSSHFLTGGFAFSDSNKFAGAFFSGRSLGESLLYNKNGMSGIIYGDPLYNPIGVKLYADESLRNVNGLEGYSLIDDDFSKIYINAFNGKNNPVLWNLSICYNDLDECNDWEIIKSNNVSLFEYPIIESLGEIIKDLNSPSEFSLKLELSDLKNPENKFTDYAKFNYVVDSDGDGLSDTWEISNFGDLSRSGEEDYDLDLFKDIEEYHAVTNPKDEMSHPKCSLDRHCGVDTPICSNEVCVCLSDEDCNEEKPYCSNEECRECDDKSQCDTNEYCWFDYTCKSFPCDSDFDCDAKDFDDCSRGTCENSFCEFTRFSSDFDCFYCASLSLSNKIGGMNITGGPDINHDGIVNNEIDLELLKVYLNKLIPCNESNDFCDYSDIDRKTNYILGVNLNDLAILKQNVGKTCNIR